MLLNHDEIRRRTREIKLISIDLDGTLLNEARELTPRSAAAVRGLLERGYLVVPTTGRTLDHSVRYFPELDGTQYAISTNGALVTELSTGKHLFCNAIPPDVAARLVSDLLDDAQSLVYVNMLTGCRTAYRDIASILALGDKRRPFGVEPVTAAAMCEWLKTTADVILEIGLNFARENGFDHYESLVIPHYPGIDFFRVGSRNLEFVKCGTSKAAALQALCEVLGIAPFQVCAIGDNGNDVDTIRFAGLGIGMGNAIRPVQDVADYITCSNEEDGAAQFLEQFFLA